MKKGKTDDNVISENVRSDYRFNKNDNDENYDDMPCLEDVPEEMIKREKIDELNTNQNNNSDINNNTNNTSVDQNTNIKPKNKKIKIELVTEDTQSSNLSTHDPN